MGGGAPYDTVSVGAAGVSKEGGSQRFAGVGPLTHPPATHTIFVCTFAGGGGPGHAQSCQCARPGLRP